MYEIAHGIDIHYDNNKANPNIVLIQGKEPLQYTTTDLLLEVISESSIFMLTEKVKTMINMYQNFTKPRVDEGFDEIIVVHTL